MKSKNAIRFYTCWRLIDDLLEELNLSDFHGFYCFLPVLTEILEKVHFFSFNASFYAPFWVKKYVFKL